MGKAVEFLNPEQARQMVELAERARAALARFSGRPVNYDAPALQLLDEWIERTPSPSREMRVLWVAFLGEIFRRRHGGEWIVNREEGGHLAVLCPTETGGVRRVEVATQVNERVAGGMVYSLALFYVSEASYLHRPSDL